MMDQYAVPESRDSGGAKAFKFPNKDKERANKKKDNSENMNDIAAWYVKSEVVSKQNLNNEKNKADKLESTVTYK